MSSKLKHLDMFPAPLNLHLRRGSKRKRSYDSEYQSFFGVVMTILCSTLSIAYLVYLIVRMYGLEDDSYNSFTLLNEMDKQDGLDILNLTSHNFMPNMHLRYFGTADKYDIFDVGKDTSVQNIDLSKLG